MSKDIAKSGYDKEFSFKRLILEVDLLNPRLKFPIVNLMRKLTKIIDTKPPTLNTSPIVP